MESSNVDLSGELKSTNIISTIKTITLLDKIPKVLRLSMSKLVPCHRLSFSMVDWFSSPVWYINEISVSYSEISGFLFCFATSPFVNTRVPL